jgi:hypothetical protein
LKLHLHHFSKIESQKESQNSKNQGFSYYFCMMKEGSGSGAGSGSGSIPLTTVTIGSGSGRPKNMWIRWIRIRIRIRNTDIIPILSRVQEATLIMKAKRQSAVVCRKLYIFYRGIFRISSFYVILVQ